MKTLPDVQSYVDSRNLRIDKVGVSNVPWPFAFSATSTDKTAQSTVGSIDMFVELPADKKGTHMSRFVQMIRNCDDALSYSSLKKLFTEMLTRLSATQVYGQLRFPFFIDRAAPVTGERGKLRIDVTLDFAVGEKESLTTTVRGPATSLCPCSKEISAYGAHNQRCELTASVQFASGYEIGVDELFGIVDGAASCSVFATLKREDEKAVTEAAYDNPKFVEDIVRDMAVALRSDDRIAWFRCESENFESIHQHNAYAQIES